MINENMDTMAPVKRVQMSKKIPKFATKETLDLISLRIKFTIKQESTTCQTVGEISEI